MNFLAHLSLSRCSADLQVGNFLGDFVRGNELSLLSAGVQRGVLMHRAIDRLTDADRDVRALNAQLAERHGRYATVVSDIAFDHFLSRNWALLIGEDFDRFRSLTYRRLLDARSTMPAKHADILTRMVEDDWLAHYATSDGMATVFRRFRRRLSRPELLNGIGDTLEELHGPFNRTLLLLFPRLQSLCGLYCE